VTTLTPVGGTPLPLTLPARLLTSEQVCTLAGITYRQLDHWLRRGYVDCDRADLGVPVGTGNPRRYTPEQTHRIRLVASLVHAGLSVPRAADLINRHLSGHDTFTAPLAPGVAVVVNLPGPRAVVA
jgi:hypothetical protein